MSYHRILSHRQSCTIGRHLPPSDLQRIGPPSISTSFTPISPKQQEQQQNPTPSNLSLFIAVDAAAHRRRLTGGRRHLSILLLPPSRWLRQPFVHRSTADSSTFSLSVSLFSSPALHTNINTHTNSYIQQQSIAAAIPPLFQLPPPYSSKISLTLPFPFPILLGRRRHSHNSDRRRHLISVSLPHLPHNNSNNTHTLCIYSLSTSLALSLVCISLSLHTSCEQQ